MLLSDYQSAVRRLLHDSQKNFWQDPDLTNYINRARKRLVLDTGCLRSLQNVNILTETEPFPPNALSIIGISVIVGSLRQALGFRPFSQFQAFARSYVNWKQFPTLFSIYQRTVYFFPVPDQSYVSEWDTVIVPSDLVDDTSTDPLYFPYDEPVAYYAAFLAKFEEQQMTEAEEFKIEYKRQYLNALAHSYQTRIPDPYGGGA